MSSLGTLSRPAKDGDLLIDTPSPSASTWGLPVLANLWSILRTLSVPTAAAVTVPQLGTQGRAMGLTTLFQVGSWCQRGHWQLFPIPYTLHLAG